MPMVLPDHAGAWQVFDKALGEPGFSGIYARLCYDLNQVLPSFKVVDEDGKEEDVEFRRVLLNKCQSEFEEGGAAMRAVEAREKRQQEEDAAKVSGCPRWLLIQIPVPALLLGLVLGPDQRRMLPNFAGTFAQGIK